VYEIYPEYWIIKAGIFEEEKEQELIIEMFNQGIEIGLIAIISKKSIEDVRKIIDEYTRSLNR
jgi:hypothetical protein